MCHVYYVCHELKFTSIMGVTLISAETSPWLLDVIAILAPPCVILSNLNFVSHGGFVGNRFGWRDPNIPLLSLDCRFLFTLAGEFIVHLREELVRHPVARAQGYAVLVFHIDDQGACVVCSR